MDHLTSISAFVHAVDTGSLAAASRRLGVSPAAVSRALAALEERLGVPLLRRTTRSLHLTPEGDGYLATCRRILAELDAAERGVAAAHDRPSGLLTVTAPLVFGRRCVRPVLDDFLDATPGVEARLLLLERFVNLVDEGVDLAIRVGHLPDSDLVATRLGELRRVICASPDYLARAGVPATPAALARHACISPSDAHGQVSWSFAPSSEELHGDGRRTAAARRDPAAPVDQRRAAGGRFRDRGTRLARMLSYQIVPELAAGRLQIVLAGFEPPPLPAHLLYPRSLAGTAKLRRFVAFAVPRLRADLAAATAIVAAAAARLPGSPA